MTARLLVEQQAWMMQRGKLRVTRMAPSYFEYQERVTSSLVVDEDDRPFESPEPEHIAAIRAYMNKLREKDPA
jgi:hypothetical protein